MIFPVPSKVLYRVILEGIKKAIDAKFRDEQGGFRPNRPCIDQSKALNGTHPYTSI
jgi:hypothetical protein